MPSRRLGGRSIVVTASLTGAVLVAGCSNGGAADTLSPVQGPAGTATVTATVPASTPAAGTAVDPAAAGAGYVEVQVQVAKTGVNETLSLDRATVNKTSLDPVSLDAT